MQWYAVVDADGTAVSFGTVVSDPLPEGLEAIEIDHPPQAGERWDAAARAVVPREPTEDEISALEAQRDVLDAEIAAKRAALGIMESGGKG